MKSVVYRIVRTLIWLPVKLLFRVHWQDRGNEPAPEDGPYLVCANHQTALDVLFLCAVLRRQQPHFMAKAELFKVPLVNKLVAALGAYPVDRGGADVSAIKNTIKMLKEGKCVGIFPQGHRQMGITPREADLKNGAAMIAVRAEATVLPCYVRTKKNRFAFLFLQFGLDTPHEERVFQVLQQRLQP